MLLRAGVLYDEVQFMMTGKFVSARGSLERIIGDASVRKNILKSHIQPGDCLIVCTCNSRYVLQAGMDGNYTASGGWFDKAGRSSMKVRVNGCTWGGCIIKVDVVAAVGLCIEFNNRVTTSPVRAIALLKRGELN